MQYHRFEDDQPREAADKEGERESSGYNTRMGGLFLTDACNLHNNLGNDFIASHTCKNIMKR